MNPKYTDIKDNFVITRGRGLALPIMQLFKNCKKLVFQDLPQQTIYAESCSD